jgi:S1-C subfamily serine protease
MIQEGKPITRGTLQTVFSYTPFDELRRLGLRPETEAQVRKRFPNQTGMLVVSDVQPGSPAESALQPGDILVQLNGELTSTFEPLEQVLDEGIGSKVRLILERGGTVRAHELLVQDLDAITPSSYLDFGDAVVHTLSYQQARHLNVPIRGVYVANPGYVLGAAGVPRGAVIAEVNGKSVNTLADFEKLVIALKDGENATLRFFSIDDPKSMKTAVMRMSRSWFAAKHCVRDDQAGVWPCTLWPADGVADPPVPASTQFAKTADPILNKLAPSTVLVNFDMPYPVSGVTERSYYGTGLVVDAKRGLVIVDRNTVPVSMGDLRLTFAGTVEIPAHVEYIHPLHNLAVLSYDPNLLGDTPVRAAVFEPRELVAGDQVWAVGLGADTKMKSQSVIVASLDPMVLPLSRTLQFRETNLETLNLVNGPNDFDGVLVDKQGRVLASWSSFAFESGREVQQTNRGIPADVLMEMLTRVQQNLPAYSLEAEFVPISLAKARDLSLPQEWIKRMEQHSPERRQVLGIARLVGGSPAQKLLRSGDILLAVDGAVANRFREVERATQKESVKVTLWREGREVSLDIATVALDGGDLDRIVMWGGAVLQKPHRALAAQRGMPRQGVFVAYFAYGSPATRYQLWAGRRIIEADGQPTPDLDAFMKAVAGREDRASVRLKTVTWNEAVEVITLKLDKRYWPSYELRRTDTGWKRTAWE